MIRTSTYGFLRWAQFCMWHPFSFLSTTSLHLAGILHVWDPSSTPTHTTLEEKGEILICKRLLPLTEGHQWWYSKILVIMTLQIVEISEYLILRELLFVWVIYAGPNSQRIHTHCPEQVMLASVQLHHSILIPVSLLMASFPRAWNCHCSSVSLVKSSPHITTHAKN